MPSPDRNLRSPLRHPILLAEDSAVIQTVVRRMLTLWGYDVVTAADGIDAWRILEGDAPPRLAIFDWMMPGLQGPELCRRLRAHRREPYTYVLLLTSRDDHEDIVEGLDAGADDYLTKPFHAQELRARLLAGERIIRLQEELLAAREALRERATIDDLTRLLNRATILESLARELELADRRGLPFSVLLVDIERFRQINDSFGHMTGDAVLREFAGRITAAAPAGASVGRYSCEEFLVILPGVGHTELHRIAANIRGAIHDEPFHVGAASFPVTGSIGIADRALPYSADQASLLRAADESLFAAKAEIRNRIAGALRASAASVAEPISTLAVTNSAGRSI